MGGAKLAGWTSRVKKWTVKTVVCMKIFVKTFSRKFSSYLEALEVDDRQRLFFCAYFVAKSLYYRFKTWGSFYNNNEVFRGILIWGNCVGELYLDNGGCSRKKKIKVRGTTLGSGGGI